MVDYFNVFVIYPIAIYFFTYQLEWFFPNLMTLFTIIKLLMTFYGFLVLVILATTITTSMFTVVMNGTREFN
tara:strand:+ start:3222 stop:3437 length:216 start_codon:yes stop_codon:yes gene_type:complete